MDRISTSTKATDLFGAGKHGFRDGNLAGGIAPTDLNAELFNGLQEESIGVIEGAGLVPAAGDYTQLRKAIDVMIRKGAGATAVAGGTADALTGAFTPAVTALANGMTVYARAASANTSATPTFKADGTVAKTIVKGNDVALAAGDIAGAGHWLALVYDSTLDKWVLQNPAIAVKAIGFGQTWQNVTASRALATNYTNTSGRPIYVSVKLSVASGENGFLTVDSLAVGQQGTAGGAAEMKTLTAIVPPGSVYQVTVTSGASSLIHWAELR